jgi:hypothetical protein
VKLGALVRYGPEDVKAHIERDLRSPKVVKQPGGASE